MRVAPPRTTKTPSPGKWNGNREAHRADCVRIVHLLRHSLEFVAYKDRKAVAAALKEIYRAVDATAAEAALSAFEAGPWGSKYAAIAPGWRRAWSAESYPHFTWLRRWSGRVRSPRRGS